MTGSGDVNALETASMGRCFGCFFMVVAGRRDAAWRQAAMTMGRENGEEGARIGGEAA